MLIKRILAFLLPFSLTFFSHPAFSWKGEASVGAGYGPENSRNYNNAGIITDIVLANVTIDSKLAFLTDSSAAWWHAGAGQPNLFAFAMSLGFRAYFVAQDNYYRPFLQVSIGPSFISNKEFGTKTQGSKFIFQDRFGGGLEVGMKEGSAFMVGLQYIHYSNAGISEPNPGFNIPFVAVIGYEY